MKLSPITVIATRYTKLFNVNMIYTLREDTTLLDKL